MIRRLWLRTCALILLLCLLGMVRLSGYNTQDEWYDEPVRLGNGRQKAGGDDGTERDGNDGINARTHKIWQTEPWNDMNLEQPVICGVHKCFVRSLQNDTSVGYIVGPASQYEKLIQAADLAAEVKNRYGVNHLYELPTNISTWLLSMYRSLLWTD